MTVETALHKVLYGLFDIPNKAVLERLVNVCRLQGLVAGDTLFEEGDQGASLYFIIEGKLAVHKSTSMAGKRQAVALLGPGSVVGEGVLGQKTVRGATLVAVEKSVLAELTLTGFMEVRQNDPQLAIDILCKMLYLSSIRLQKSSARLALIM
jgi:CRP-like cAMP-binding protein